MARAVMRRSSRATLPTLRAELPRTRLAVLPCVVFMFIPMLTADVWYAPTSTSYQPRASSTSVPLARTTLPTSCALPTTRCVRSKASDRAC